MPSKVYSAPTEEDAVYTFRSEHPDATIDRMTPVGQYAWEIGWDEPAMLTPDRFETISVTTYSANWSYNGPATEATYTWRAPWDRLRAVPWVGSYLERMERGMADAILEAAKSKGVLALQMHLERRVQPLWVDYRMTLLVAPQPGANIDISGGVGWLPALGPVLVLSLVIVALAVFGIVASATLTSTRELIHGPSRVVRDAKGNIVRDAKGNILYEDAGGAGGLIQLALVAVIGLGVVLLLKGKGGGSNA